MTVSLNNTKSEQNYNICEIIDNKLNILYSELKSSYLIEI